MKQHLQLKRQLNQLLSNAKIKKRSPFEMKNILQKKFHLKKVGLFAFLILSACATPNTYTPTFSSSPYSRTIELTSNNPQLQSALEQRIIKNRRYILQPQNGFSEFHITVETTMERIKTLETKPLLLGRIQKTRTPVTFKAHYKIGNQTSLTLAEGHIQKTTETLARVYPSLRLNSNIEPEALNDVADQIIKEAAAHIAVTPWSTRVTGMKDETHVTIAVGESAGLELGDTFITESQPTAKLQVVMFEQQANGNNRAILGLLEGFLPQAGRKLIAEK